MIARVRNYTYRRRRSHYHRRNADSCWTDEEEDDESCAADAVDEGVGKFIHTQHIHIHVQENTQPSMLKFNRSEVGMRVFFLHRIDCCAKSRDTNTILIIS